VRCERSYFLRKLLTTFW